jgi:hypothetical protein
MKPNLTPEQRKQRTENIVKVLSVLGLSLILGPFFFTILHGLGAIAALIVATAVLFTVWKFIPWFAMKIGNARLKAIKAEASKNPVETLQNQLVEKRNALTDFKENIGVFTAQVLSFADEVKKYVDEGLEDAQTYVDQLKKMRQLLDLRKEKLARAEEAVAEFEVNIQRTDRKWKMALAAQNMNEAAGQIAGDIFDKICIETAMDSVQQKLNESFADLEIALADENKEKAKQIVAERHKQKQLTTTSVVVEALPVVEDAEKVPVRRK